MSDQDNSGLGNAIEQWGTLGIGVVGGVTGGVMTIWEKFYDYWKSIPDYTDLVEWRDTKRAEIRDKRLPFVEASNEYHKVEKKYLRKFSTRLKEVDDIVSADGPGNIIKGTLQRFDRLGHFDKGRVVFNAALSGVVTVGAVWALSQHNKLRDKLDESESRQQHTRHG